MPLSSPWSKSAHSDPEGGPSSEAQTQGQSHAPWRMTEERSGEAEEGEGASGEPGLGEEHDSDGLGRAPSVSSAGSPTPPLLKFPPVRSGTCGEEQ